MHVLLADIGTGSVKVEGYSQDAEVVERVVEPYPDRAPGGRDDELDPEVWYDAFRRAVRSLADGNAGAGRTPPTGLDSVKYIVLTGQMQNLILLGENGPLRNAVLYYAQRPGERYRRFLDRIGSDRLTGLIRNTPDTAQFPAKLLHLAEEEPEVLAAVRTILCGAHDYVAWRLTGHAGTDPTTAATTGMMNPVGGDWVPEILRELPIDAETPAPIVPGDRDMGPIQPERAEELGLPPDVRVIHGVGDVGASVLAMEATGHRRSCYLGTSGWVLDTGPLDHPGDPERGVFNLRHPVRNELIRVAPLLTATGAFDWLLELFSPDTDARTELFEQLPRDAARMTPEAGRVVFLPYLSGERSPFKDPAASGTFIGLTRGTGRIELFRAVEEGVAFAVRSILDALDQGVGDRVPEPILLSGGGAAVSGMPDLLADVTGETFELAEEARFSGTRALLTLVPGTGSVASPVRAARTSPTADSSPTVRTSPAQASAPAQKGGRSFRPRYTEPVYDGKYRVFLDAYRKNRELMHMLSEKT